MRYRVFVEVNNMCKPQKDEYLAQFSNTMFYIGNSYDYYTGYVTEKVIPTIQIFSEKSWRLKFVESFNTIKDIDCKIYQTRQYHKLMKSLNVSDKYGECIFEGDIVKLRRWDNSLQTFTESYIVIHAFAIEKQRKILLSYNQDELKIICNIFAKTLPSKVSSFFLGKKKDIIQEAYKSIGENYV